MDTSTALSFPTAQQLQPDESDEDLAVVLAKAYGIARARARQIHPERQNQSLD